MTNTSHTLTTIADRSNTAFEFQQNGLPASQTNVASLSQNVTGLTIGASYLLNWSVYFGACTPNYGFLRINLDHQLFATKNACDDSGAVVGRYGAFAGRFIATANPENLEFQFVIGNQTDSAVIRLDKLYISPDYYD